MGHSKNIITVKFILEDADFEGEQRDKINSIFLNNIKCNIIFINSENNITLQGKEATIDAVDANVIYCTMVLDDENYENRNRANSHFSRTWIEGDSSLPIIYFAE